MTVIGESVLAQFGTRYADSRRPLARFLGLVKAAQWKHLLDLKQSFSSADYTSSGIMVFDIGGNKYRVLASVDFVAQIVDLRAVLTHEEYDREKL